MQLSVHPLQSRSAHPKRAPDTSFNLWSRSPHPPARISASLTPDADSALLLQRQAAESLENVRPSTGSYLTPRQLERYSESETGEEFVVITNRYCTSTAILLSQELPGFRTTTAA